MWLSLVLEFPIASALMLGCVLWWVFDLRLPPSREVAHRLGRVTGRLLKRGAHSAVLREDTNGPGQCGETTPKQLAAIR